MDMQRAGTEAMPLVSVVMPAYNVSRFLRQAIESVLSQTYRQIELIVVDDCSTDDSLQIMREYEQKDARVHVLAGETNQGVARARNRGIQAATGKYIALLDSDDVWVESKIERQIELLLEKGADIAYGAVDFVDENNRRIKTFAVPSETNYDEMLVRCFFICSTVVIRAELLKNHLFRPEYYHEDFLLWLELLGSGATAVGVVDVVAYYRQLTGSRSNNKLHAAKHRWRIYREALHMSFAQSCAAFVRYAFWGVMKYYV